MSDEKTENIEKFQTELDSFLQTNAKVKVETLSEKPDIPYWIDSGCYAFNWIISDTFKKGIPGTKAIMISGESGKGKSLVTDVILGKNIEAGGASYKLDIEDAGTSGFTAQIVGSKEIADKIRVISPKTLTTKTAIKDQVITIEKLTKLLNRIIDFQVSKGKDKAKSVVVCIDSVTQLTSEKEVEKIMKDKDAKDMTSSQKMRELFRTITQKQKDANLTIIGIAQLTANIGVIFGPSKTENAKGSGFKYASSLSVQMTTDREIVNNDTDKIPVGIRMRMKTTKNRCAFKNRDAWIYFYFNKGIDKWGGMIELLAQYKVFKPSAKPSVYGEFKPTNTFKWTDPDGVEHTFKLGTFKKFIADLKWSDEEILDIWEEELNTKYKLILEEEGYSEEDLLSSEDLEEDEEYLAEDSE